MLFQKPTMSIGLILVVPQWAFDQCTIEYVPGNVQAKVIGTWQIVIRCIILTGGEK
jgi:hypothetical protein